MIGEKGMDTAEDYLARLNIEGTRGVWRKNRIKIDYVLRKTRKYIRRASTACEVGIGDGYLLSRLKEYGMKVTGIDVSSFCVEHIQKVYGYNHSDIRLIAGDITTVALAEDQFELIACLDVLEHIPGDGLRDTLRKFQTSLKKDGKIIGTLPLGENLQDSMVMCPKCGHKFHRIGHFHSFQDMTELMGLFSGIFRIIKTGVVPNPWFSSNLLNYTCTKAIRLIKRLTRRKFTSTVYFVGVPIKPDKHERWQ
jgi:ubiquinone/menaquinone biosynthesis C-methylase UbiE